MNNEAKNVISLIVERIKKHVDPDKIILFGSQTQGQTPSNSDIDLLVIKDSPLRRDDRDKEIRPFLRDIVYPLDIFMYSNKEIDSLKGRPGSFVNKMISTGKVLYERKI